MSIETEGRVACVFCGQMGAHVCPACEHGILVARAAHSKDVETALYKLQAAQHPVPTNKELERVTFRRGCPVTEVLFWYAAVMLLGSLAILFAGCNEDEPTILDELQMDCSEITNEVMSKVDVIIEHDVHLDAIPFDQQLALEFCENELFRKGYKFVDKFEGGPLSRYTTTAVKHVAVGVNFADRPLWSKMMLMCHEDGHANTEDRMMPSWGGWTLGQPISQQMFDELFGMGMFYARPSGRLSMEVTMYALGYVLAERIGLPPQYLIDYKISRSNALHTGYVLTTVPAECIYNMLGDVVEQVRGTQTNG